MGQEAWAPIGLPLGKAVGPESPPNEALPIGASDPLLSVKLSWKGTADIVLPRVEEVRARDQ